MFIDTDGKILFGEEAESFTHLMLGGIWSEFTQTIPEPQAKLLDRAATDDTVKCANYRSRGQSPRTY